MVVGSMLQVGKLGKIPKVAKAADKANEAKKIGSGKDVSEK